MTNAHLPARLVFLLAPLLFACDDDSEKVVVPPIVQFENSTVSMLETEEKVTLRIVLSRSATVSGEVSVQLTSAHMDQFSFEPSPENNILRLPLATGESSVSFDVHPVNNTLLDGDKKIDFAIASVSQGFQVGTIKSLAATLEDDETPADVSFLFNHGTVRENTTTPSVVTIALSHQTLGSGLVKVSFESNGLVYGTDFVTEPALANNRITLPFEAGADHLELKVIPTDNGNAEGDRAIAFNITDVEGPVTKGGSLRHELKVTDDDAGGTGKSYEIFAGIWRYKRDYAYDNNGLLTSVTWEQNTPGFSQGTHTYYYDQDNKIQKIVTSPVEETRFVWEGGKITKSEEYKNGQLKKYTLYGYDDAGNVGEAAVHFRQPNGEIKLSILLVYLYKTDGNLYKQLTYIPIEGSDDYNLNSTRTYDNYIDVENPFPMVEILPNMVTQRQLPSSYRVEENGHDFLYTFTYEYGEDGRPAKRTATSSSGSETAYYQYY